MNDAPFNRDQHLASADTHDVINQPTPLADYNVYRSDTGAITSVPAGPKTGSTITASASAAI